MQVIIKKDLSFVGVYRDDSEMMSLLGLSRYKFKKLNHQMRWEHGEYIIFYPHNDNDKSNRGGGGHRKKFR